MENLLTPCLLGTIIVCCTIIALALVSLVIYQTYKERENKLGTYIFNGSVIVFIATSIFSYLFHGSDKVLDFISLASAIISIILAVITIVYSYYTNSRSAGQVETLDRAAQKVEDTNTTLQRNIQKIIDAVNRVERKTDRLLDTNGALGSNSNNTFKNFDTNKYVKTYINIASPLGVMALYACIKSKDYGVPFSLHLLGNEPVVSYCGGFLIAAVSAGLISANIQFVNNTADVKVSEYIPIVKETVEKWIVTTGKSFDFVPPLKESIDNYFEANKSTK